MERTIYIEKTTGKWYLRSSWSSGPDGGTSVLREYNNVDNKVTVSGKELEIQFDIKRWPSPVIKVEEVKPRYPIQIKLYCPECGSLLVTDGNAYCTSPLQYEHKCSNPDCKYEKCTRSYYSGMLCLVTDEQEKKINDGSFDELIDGRLIKVKEADLWKFR